MSVLKQVLNVVVFITFFTQQVLCLWAGDSQPTSDEPIQPVTSLSQNTTQSSTTSLLTTAPVQDPAPIPNLLESIIQEDSNPLSPPTEPIISDPVVTSTADQTAAVTESPEPVVADSSDLENQITPFTISVSLSPNGSPNLTVAVAADGTATVKRFSTTKTGIFNLETMSIEIAFSTSFGPEKWILKFKENGSDTSIPFLLDSFQRVSSSSSGTYKSDDTSYFTEDGRLDHVEYIETGSSSTRYVHNFYGYDENGDNWITVIVEKTVFTNGGIYNRASFIITDTLDKQKTSVNLYPADDALFHSIQSANQYQEIENLAEVKTTTYFNDHDLSSFLYSIESARNESDVFVPRRVNKMFEKVFIVVGNPDVLSGETDDLLFQDGQMVGEYRISFGEVFNDALNYGLSFSKKVQNTNPSPSISASSTQAAGVVRDIETYEVVAVVDFPSVQTVELNGMLYDIQIDPLGVITLSENMEEEVRQQLLDRTDAELEMAQAKISELELQYEQLKEAIEAQNATLQSEFSGLIQSLDEILNLMKAMLNGGNLEVGMAEVLKQYIADSDLLKVELTDQMANYLNQILISHLAPDRMRLQAWRSYTERLTSYRESVVNADSLEELETLANNFPVYVDFPMPALPVFGPSPTEELGQWLEKGKLLLEKAQLPVIIAQMKFGEGRVIIEKSVALDGSKKLVAKVQVYIGTSLISEEMLFKTLAQFGVISYSVLNLESAPSFEIKTVNGETVTFRHSLSQYVIVSKVISEMYGSLEKSITVKLAEDQLFKTSEVLTYIYNKVVNGQVVPYRKIVQSIIWKYDYPSGALLSENTSRFTNNGSSVHIQKIAGVNDVKVQAYGYENRILFNGSLSQVTMNKEESSGLLTLISGLINTSTGIKINISKDFVQLTKWTLSSLSQTSTVSRLKTKPTSISIIKKPSPSLKPVR